MTNPLDVLLPDPPAQPPTYRWGTVTNSNPLHILLDGDVSALDASPSGLASGYTAGDRVYVVIAGGRAVILGVANGPQWNLAYANGPDAVTVASGNSTPIDMGASISVPVQAGKPLLLGWNVWVTVSAGTSGAAARVGVALSGAVVQAANSDPRAFSSMGYYASTQSTTLSLTRTIVPSTTGTLVASLQSWSTGTITATANYSRLWAMRN